MVTYMLVGLPEKPAMNHISMALQIFSFPAVSFAVLQSKIMTKPQVGKSGFSFFAIVDNK